MIIFFSPKNKEHPKFINADATIRFGNKLNDLFDIFNTKLSAMGSENTFKRPLSKENKNEVFSYFNDSIRYISGLKIRDETGGVKNILESQSNTGFKGFIIDMFSLMGIYLKYVENEQQIDYIPTYSMNQDHVEIFFSKNRLFFIIILFEKYSHLTFHLTQKPG